jgi:hypothetical protein
VRFCAPAVAASPGVRSFVHPSSAGVEAVFLLMEMHLHVMHKGAVLMLLQALMFLVDFLSKKAAARGCDDDPLHPFIVHRINFYKRVRAPVGGLWVVCPYRLHA